MRTVRVPSAVCLSWVYPVAVAEDSSSKTQLDKLGDRLRAGTATEADLKALDEYRRSFRPAYDEVVRIVKGTVGLEGTGRPAKTTAAIVDKLQRQRIRLTQMQDIAGFRLVVDDVVEQDRITRDLQNAIPSTHVDDRRIRPSHGYRAVHLIVTSEARLVEIQIRTHEQHSWAEVSEKLSDVVDQSIKYGGGPEALREVLVAHSELIAEWEGLERNLSLLLENAAKTRAVAARLREGDPMRSELLESANESDKAVVSRKAEGRRKFEDLARTIVRTFDRQQRKGSS